MSSHEAQFVTWFEALYARHTQDLTFTELRKCIAALSRVYTAARGKLPAGGALDTRGKRAAFAAFYAPLHYLVVQHALQEAALGSFAPTCQGPIVDLGCGTGVAGAAWSRLTGSPPVLGLDLNAWALGEAQFNWAHLGLRGKCRREKLTAEGLQRLSGARGIVMGYVLNELPDDVREALLPRLLALHAAGTQIAIIEPIARSVTPWWQAWETAFCAAGGRALLVRKPSRLPDKMALLSRAAGLDHRELTCRALTLSPRTAP